MSPLATIGGGDGYVVGANMFTRATNAFHASELQAELEACASREALRQEYIAELEDLIESLQMKNSLLEEDLFELQMMWKARHESVEIECESWKKKCLRNEDENKALRKSVTMKEKELYKILQAKYDAPRQRNPQQQQQQTQIVDPLPAGVLTECFSNARRNRRSMSQP